MEVLLKNKKIEVTYYPTENYFYFDWIGFQTKESIMEIGYQLVEVFRKKNCSKIINDNTKVSGPWQDAAEWTVTHWFPAMEAAGLKRFAWIFSQNIFAELSAKKATPETGMVKSFQSLNEARKWLLEEEVGA